jgi:hypothetical protein
MKNVLFLIVLLFASMVCVAQADPAKAEPASAAPETVPPVITFTQAWSDATPPFYSIAADSTGRTTYHSTPRADNTGDPYDLRFNLSQQTRARLFDLARQLNYFHGNFDFKKSRIAYTGTKTLRFQNGKDDNITNYNWSDNLKMQQVTKIFQNISETIELGRVIADKYRFDKLGVDAEMRKLEDAEKGQRTAELQAIQPILSRIAKDSSLMNITRRRAEQLLAKIPQDVRISGQP